jgi:hypothetical protein
MSRSGRTFTSALWTLLMLGFTASALAQSRQAPAPGIGSGARAFEQLEELLPTPSEARLASGAPGPQYWQQQVDYDIKVRLDDEHQRLEGSETISYTNRSPHTLTYLWLQLDQNRFKPDSLSVRSAAAPALSELPYTGFAQTLEYESFKGGFEIGAVTDGSGAALEHVIVDTMMRVDLPQPLGPGAKSTIAIKFAFNIIDGTRIRARTGHEKFKDGNYIYEIAQFYPRAVAYLDYQGWQHKPYLGSGEFTLQFGNFELAIDAPADHVVAASGTLQNASTVLSPLQRERLAKARTAAKPQYIVTPQEAAQAEKNRAAQRKTWRFQANNVRDVAFASSRKFIWDAMGVESGGRRVLAMSFFPNEGDPLWSQYSTQAVAHTIQTYSRYTFDYPYPVAISVNGPVGGMEYPMICFNQPRPYEDKTYWASPVSNRDRTWERSKYGLISVVIHEVGHNYFPMIVNSDERQWTWMDEGLNTFLQFLAEQSWERNYPSRRGEPKDIVQYMLSAEQVPIMTNSESIVQFGNNSYAKPATALNILRESILGRELFDFAFKEYARRWKFKHPTPADFFRTMEDASGVDLDWFWRGWFYGTAYVDVAIDKVLELELDTRDPKIEKPRMKVFREQQPQTVTMARNATAPVRAEAVPELLDFYNKYDEFQVTPYDEDKYRKFIEGLEEQDRELLKYGKKLYVVEFSNKGGLVTPLPLQITYQSGKRVEVVIPAEIWRYNAQKVGKLLIADEPISGIELDPHLAIADADTSNNRYPPQPEKTRFQLFKMDEETNPMKREADSKKSTP